MTLWHREKYEFAPKYPEPANRCWYTLYTPIHSCSKLTRNREGCFEKQTVSCAKKKKIDTHHEHISTVNG